MAISVLDVRDTVLAPRVSVPSLRVVPGTAVASPAAAARRLPLAIVGAGLLSIVESVGLLALALTGLDGVLSTSAGLSGGAVALGLLVLAGWIVLAAGGGAALIDGAGRRLVLTVAWAELGVLAVLGVVATTSGLPVPAALPLPLLLLVAAAVPVGKLLLVGAPSAVRWIAQGPRVRERRVDPVAAHRVLATVTLGLIGVSLAAVAVLVPAQGGGPGAPASAVFTQH